MAAILAWGLVVLSAHEVGAAEGFQLDRFEPAAPGNPFVGVAHPWYSSTRWVAAGLSFDYGHNVLLGGLYTAEGAFVRTAAIVAHQLGGRVEVAGSFLDRVQLSGALPVVLLERGEAAFGVSALSGVHLSDPRLGLMVRLWGQADRDPVSFHAGGHLWIPVGASGAHAGDPGVRGAPEVVAAGVFGKRQVRWAVTAAFLVRGVTSLGFGPASSIGSELQLRAGLAWADPKRRYHVGPEAWFATPMSGDNAFAGRATSLELLLAGQIQIARQVQVGAAVGSGVVSTLGVPDVRAVLRLAYAPVRATRPEDRDRDGVPDAEDLCPTTAGARGARGCPDRDADGVPDAEDLCPDARAGTLADPARRGCPAPDEDGDGVPDAEDLCPNARPGTLADPARRGCPAPDSDGDGVPDAEDACPAVPPGASPDPARPGCPRDVDGDGVPDAEDACPNLAGPRHPDRARSGCPTLSAEALELKRVHFAVNEATLLPEASPVLDEAAQLLLRYPEIKRIEVAGHADDTGTAEWNLRLSERRAQTVLRYLVERGVPHKRLRAVGYGSTRPLSAERSEESRARNRRVELRAPGR